MPFNEDDFRQILISGRESLNTEFKPWFPPDQEFGISIIAKGCMALRNAGGGLLIIGMNDDGQPDNRQHIPDVRSAFHHDAVQEIVSRFASEPFEVIVHFVQFDGLDRVIIEVPPGIRTPVVSRNNLPRNAGEHAVGSLIQQGAVYVRTLESNGRASSSMARVPDWPRLMETCFNNREADIGSFLRRQLSGIDLQAVSSALLQMGNVVTTPIPAETGLTPTATNRPTPAEFVGAFMDECHQKFLNYCREANCPDVGYLEVAAGISGEFTEPELTPQSLWTLGNTPDRSGWPPFFCVTNDNVDRAEKSWDDAGVEAFIYNTEVFNIIDLARIESSGRFYFAEGFYDDLSTQIRPREQMDFVIQASRLTDVFAKILHFAKTFCGSESDAVLTIAIRWHKLSGRRLTSWASPRRSFVTRGICRQDEMTTRVSIPVSCAIDAIGPFVGTVMSRLTRLFGGWQFEPVVIQQIVEERLGIRAS